MNVPIREITQFLFGVMLFFGGIMLIPKAIFQQKKGNIPKSILYLALGGISFFLSVVSFLMAFD